MVEKHEATPRQEAGALHLKKLAEMLRTARSAKGYSQSRLARDVTNLANLTAPTISAFEKGTRRPSLFQLAKMADILEVETKPLLLARLRDELVEEIRKSEEASNEESRTWTSEKAMELLQDLDDLTEKSSIRAMPQRVGKLHGRTLQDFPEAFPNLVIVTGDKREDPPKSAGDIGAYSASPVDDRWIHSLCLPSDTEKVSDKEFVISSPQRLKEIYGHRNMLVIGSPASNHLARIANRGALFRFNLNRELQDKLQDFLNELRITRDKDILSRMKQEKEGELKRLMRAFYAYGIVDPIKGDVAGFAIPNDRDYATVTLARNPFSEAKHVTRVCVIAAGFHHPGTIQALKWLGDKDAFSKRPYGGILEVEIDMEKPWEERMREARARWETDEYNKETLIEGLDRLGDRGSALMNVDSEFTQTCRELVENL